MKPQTDQIELIWESSYQLSALKVSPGPPVNCNDKLAVEIFVKLANITVRIFAKPLLREEKVQWEDKKVAQPGHN